MPAEPEGWRALARCRGMDPEWFFPYGHGPEVGKEQKAFCHGCPVMEECGEAGLRERFGIWGGRSESQRRKVRKDRERRQAVA